MADEIYLSEEDEKAVEQAWERIEKEGLLDDSPQPPKVKPSPLKDRKKEE